MAKWSLAASLIVASGVLAGCGGERPPEKVEVEGTVTMNGEPIENLRVEFWPENDGPASAGVTDAQGRFVLEAIDRTGKGAVKGVHKVLVRDTTIVTKFVGRQEDVDVTDGKKPRIGLQYYNPMRTPLEVTITGPTKDVKLEIEPYKEQTFRIPGQ